jgi:hypothetical protein
MIGSWGQFYKQVFAPTGAIQALFLQYRRNVTAQPLFKETLMINVKSLCQAWVTLSTSAFSIQLAYICSFMHVKQKSICSKFQLALVTYVLKFSVKMIYFLFVKNSKWHLQTQGHSEDEEKNPKECADFFHWNWPRTDSTKLFSEVADWHCFFTRVSFVCEVSTEKFPFLHQL